MNIKIRRRRDTFIRMKAFSLEFPDDFPAGSPQEEQMQEISAVIDEINLNAGEQTSGVGAARFAYNAKANAREVLRERMDDVSTLADTLAYSIDGVDMLFKIPKKLPDADLLALADAFIERAATYKADFVRYGLKSTFINDLQTAKDAFEASLTAPESATESKVEATGNLDQAVRRGMIARTILKGIFKVKYKTESARMRAWETASHLDRDDKNDDDDDSKTPKM